MSIIRSIPFRNGPLSCQLTVPFILKVDEPLLRPSQWCAPLLYQVDVALTDHEDETQQHWHTIKPGPLFDLNVSHIQRDYRIFLPHKVYLLPFFGVVLCFVTNIGSD